MKTTVYQKENSDNFKNTIYSKRSNGSFYSPFSLNVDDMERLILINFEKDPDEFYNIFELQQACDKNGKKCLLVIAYRNDGGTDVYHQPAFPFASQANVLNDVNFFINPLEGAKFEVNTDHLDVFFAFEDKYNRKIEVRINENRKPKKKPFFLLAPVGIVAKNPKSFPVYSLYEMSFSKQKHTDIEIEINKVKHKPDTFPLPIDCSKNYFTRYSADTFNVDWNKNFDGQLLPLIPGIDNRVKDREVAYELVNNRGHYEIKCISTTNNKHHLNISFYPPMPDIACLNTDLVLEGSFIISTDKTTGSIRGEYHLKRQGNEIDLKLHPNKGWEPNENRYILKLLFLFVKVFENWPKDYIWNAQIKLDAINHPVMKSSWERG